ncbi:MAG: hypothetical protein M0P31_17600 [Solirubrobacteraceae bacterium]|nr:hypothetical protein [Solirubrobacteraceae bacterium]
MAVPDDDDLLDALREGAPAAREAQEAMTAARARAELAMRDVVDRHHLITRALAAMVAGSWRGPTGEGLRLVAVDVGALSDDVAGLRVRHRALLAMETEVVDDPVLGPIDLPTGGPRGTVEDLDALVADAERLTTSLRALGERLTRDPADA